MSVLNIRNVPEGLVEKVKLMALIEKKPLREKVIEILEQATSGIDFGALCHGMKKETTHE